MRKVLVEAILDALDEHQRRLAFRWDFGESEGVDGRQVVHDGLQRRHLGLVQQLRDARETACGLQHSADRRLQNGLWAQRSHGRHGCTCAQAEHKARPHRQALRIRTTAFTAAD